MYVRQVGGEGWQEKVHDREEWKKLLKMARNRQILQKPMECTNEWIYVRQKEAEDKKWGWSFYKAEDKKWR